MKKFLIDLKKQEKLKLVEISEEICNSYIKKSESNLISSKILLKNKKLEESVALTYYSMYNLVIALFFRTGIKCENHSASIFLLKEIFGIDNEIIYDAKKERIDKQYYIDFKVSEKEVEEGILSAEEFCKLLRIFISELNYSKIQSFRNKFLEMLK